MPQPDPVIVRCFLCKQPRDGLIVTVRSRAWWTAVDHALDEHRAHLLASPRKTQRVFTITTDGEPRALRPGDPSTRS